jgi:predicted transcriptional regulator
LTAARAVPTLELMEVRLTPDLEAKLEKLATESGRPKDELVQDAVAGYCAELAQVREILDGRYDEIKSGRVKPIDGVAGMTKPRYDASAMLRDAATHNGIRLSTLIAETGLWANPEVHKKLLTVGGAFFLDRRRYRASQGEQRGQRVGAVMLDDNTFANGAIKRALGVSRADLLGFEACHIWPLTCYDERYHTAIANLVLLPRALAGLTDHDDEVRAVLQYRSYELYGWHPAEASKPMRPESYPETWLDPLPFSSTVERAVTRRLRRVGLAIDEADAGPNTTGDGTGEARPRTRFDVTVGEVTTHNLPKRIAILAVVRGLVAAGVLPKEIASVLHWRGSRLFRSAAGKLLRSELVQSASSEAENRGETFDPLHFFCEDTDLIFADGRTYAFSNQWGEDTQRAVDALLKAFPAHNVTCSASRQ